MQLTGYIGRGNYGKAIVSRKEVAAFNTKWPCSTLRDTRSYWFEFDHEGNLVDTDCPEQDAGPAVSAMVADCWEYIANDTPPTWSDVDQD
jgi:hypothetical protein